MVRLSVHILMIMWAFFFFGNVDAESLLSNQWEGTGNRCFLITSKKEADIKVFDIFLLCNRNLTVISQLYKQVKW